MIEKISGRTTTITIDYEEYIVDGFQLPQPKDGWRVDWKTKYIIKGVPVKLKDFFEELGFDVKSKKD